MGYKEHKLRENGQTIITYNHSKRVRVCMTTGYSKSLEENLSTFCSNDANVIIPFPALFSEIFGLKRGSAYRLEICRFVTASMEHHGLHPNVDNLMASLFQSARPESVRMVLKSSSLKYAPLFPSSWVNKPISVDGLVSVVTSPRYFSCLLRHFSLHFVAVCTGTAEKVREAATMLDVNCSSVRDYIRVAVMEIMRKTEQLDSVERAIHETADISVPETLLYSPDTHEQKRLLPIPKSTSSLEKNQRIVQEFIMKHIPSCLGNGGEIERLARELIGEAALSHAKDCMDGSVCNRDLVYQVYRQWKVKIGDDIDFVPLINVFEKLGLRELRDRCKLFVKEHSFCFTLHELNCQCFVEE